MMKLEKRKWTKWDTVYWGMFLIPFLISACAYPYLPEQVPTHWGFDNQVDGYSSRPMAAWGIPAFMLFMALVVNVSLELDPRREQISRSREMKAIARWLIAAMAVGVQLLIVLTALGIAVDVGLTAQLMVAVLVLVMGNYLPRCRQNYTMGIRTPWTLNDEENWKKTHRMAGRLWLAGGILMLFNAFFGADFLLFVILIVIALVPCGYSYLLYRKSEKS